MIGKSVKCDTCKKIQLLDAPPWCCCEPFPDDVPSEYYQNELDEPSKCPYYEFNPDWDINSH